MRGLSLLHCLLLAACLADVTPGSGRRLSSADLIQASFELAPPSTLVGTAQAVPLESSTASSALAAFKLGQLEEDEEQQRRLRRRERRKAAAAAAAAAAANAADAGVANPAPTLPPTPTPPPTLGGGCPDAQAAWDLANAIRAQWRAGPLSWSPVLADRAQAWANTCSLAHSPNFAGENLMIGPQLSGCQESVQGWANEAPYYTPGADWTPAAGHFTQLVWGGSTTLGCGMAACPGANFVVCYFDPPGNVVGQFAANVG